MQNLHVVQQEALPAETLQPASTIIRLVVPWAIGIGVAFGLGTWLVWWAASVQRTFALQDIRAACQRVMPETTERCVDTVIIQRGGARR